MAVGKKSYRQSECVGYVQFVSAMDGHTRTRTRTPAHIHTLHTFEYI